MKTTNSFSKFLIKRRSINIAMLVVFTLSCILILPSSAKASIAKIASFKGEVIVQSGENITKVAAPGYQVNNGDIVLTKQGEAQITFEDGGIVRINPYTQILIQESKEETGVLFFKRTEVARRITCYLGKLWFKSGLSRTRNYLQSPTAVAGLRGSDGDYGYDPVKMQTYLNMYSGEAAVVGNVIRGIFDNPGISAAAKAQIYQSLVQAYNKTEQARMSGNAIGQAQAKIDALKVAKEAAQTLLRNNPDAKVRQQAQLANAAADASIAAAKAALAVELIKNAPKKDAAALQRAEAAAKAAAAAAEQAKRLADTANPDLNRLNQLVKRAEDSSDIAQGIQNEVAPATVAPTTAAPTTVAPTTAAPTTAAMTTVLTTIPETTIRTSIPTSSTTIRPTTLIPTTSTTVHPISPR
jgi:hypothetical protein